ncbi:40S ribosomal protein S15 [Sigmodon hispidus]
MEVRGGGGHAAVTSRGHTSPLTSGSRPPSQAEVEQKKKRTFYKFIYHGVDLDQLLEMSYEQLMQLYSSQQRLHLNHGLRWNQHALLKHLKKAKKEALPMEKPEEVEIKPEMIGHYLGEFSITYKPVKHGWPGMGATNSSRFIALK